MEERGFVIELPFGGFVDRGGRRAHSIFQIRLFKTKEKAQAEIDNETFLVDWQNDEKHADATIVPFKLEIGGEH